MQLRDWRIRERLSQAQLGAALGFEAGSQASQVERIENGKIKVDADLIAAIETLTGGAVGAGDMNATRLAWLEANGKARAFRAEQSGEVA